MQSVHITGGFLREGGPHGIATRAAAVGHPPPQGIVKTRGKNSGSGNTDWEERNGIKWSTRCRTGAPRSTQCGAPMRAVPHSETRLYEILETLCGGSSHACNAFKEDHEELIEEWWRRRRSEDDAGAELKRALCVEGAKVCCPAGHYGKKCKWVLPPRRATRLPPSAD